MHNAQLRIIFLSGTEKNLEFNVIRFFALRKNFINCEL